MFLLSCRAHPLRTGLPLLAEYAVSPGLVLCLAAEPSSVHFRQCPAGFCVELSPLAPIPSTPATRAVSIDWDAGARELVIRAEPHADTAVYYHVDPQGGFVCASRVALLREAGVPIEENEALLPEYFRYRYVLPPHTLFRDIYQLAKAELRVRIARERCRLQTPRRYPVFPEQETAETDPAALADRTLEILEASFEQLRPKAASVVVPLSGGMDSSVLFRLAQRAFGPSDAWSAGYPFEADAQNREREYAASAAEAFAARHRYHAGTTASYLEALIRSIAAAEEPVHHMQSAMIEQLFSDAVPIERDLVVLGTGASGVFGSPLQQLLHRNARRPLLWRTLARSPLPPLVAYASRRTGRGRRLARRLALPQGLERALPDPRSALASVDAYGDPAWIAARFGATPADLVRTRSELLDGYAERALLDRIAVIDLFDKTQFLWAKILHSVGRRSWFPLMQSDVQRYVLGTPWALRLRSNKFLLAEVARRLAVPEFILGRAKSGFGVRRDDWAVRGGPLEPLIEVAAKRVNASELRSLQSREPGRAQAFWCLLNLGLWRRLCIDGDASEALLAELRARS